MYDVEGSGEGPHVFLAHATGMCAGCWADVANALKPHVSGMTLWDARGHGRSGPGGDRVSWWDMAADAGSVRDATPVERAIGVGHSMGGATLLMAQLRESRRFERLVLVEPIVPPPPYRVSEHRLSVLARKRKRRFESREAVRANFQSKPPFDHWLPASLEGYLTGGFRELDDGSVEPACHPEFEAIVFEAADAHGLFEQLHRTGAPVDLIFAEAFDTLPREWVDRLVETLPASRLIVVPGADHFIPMARPEAVIEVVLAGLG